MRDNIAIGMIPMIIFGLIAYGVIQIVGLISYEFLYKDLVKETVQEIVEKRCVLK